MDARQKLEAETYALNAEAVRLVCETATEATEGTAADAGRLAVACAASLAALAAATARRAAVHARRTLADGAAAISEANAVYYAARGLASPDAAALRAATAPAREAMSETGRRLADGAALVMRCTDGTARPLVEGAVYELATLHAAAVGPNSAEVVARLGTTLARHGVLARADDARAELGARIRRELSDEVWAAENALRKAQALDFGADGIEVSAHGLCAPDHLPHQGRRYTFAQFEALQATLARPLGDGHGCRHIVSGVVIGIGSPAFSREELAAFERNSLAPVTLPDGSTCTRYEYTQIMRRQEARLRFLVAKRAAQEAAGLDASAVSSEFARLRNAYAKGARAAGITPRPWRFRT